MSVAITTTRSTPNTTLPPVAWRVVGVIAALKVVFHLATADFAGLHRDEHYYLAGGHHLAWGYVDHPPLVPLLYRVGEELFGTPSSGCTCCRRSSAVSS